MYKKIGLAALLALTATAVSAQINSNNVTKPVEVKTVEVKKDETVDMKVLATSTKSIVDLPVPHIWEIPDGVWVNPWSNACEESAIVMVEEYYLNRGEVIMPKQEVKTKLPPLFAWENKVFGSNADTDSKRTNRIINEYSSYEGIIKENPTLEEIKAELAAGHPIISFHYGYDLKNPHHRFRRGGSSYHVIVLTGYDDVKQEFMVNDSELSDALDYRYPYAIIMDSLHDFDHSRGKADGTPVVIFSRPKQIVKAQGKGAIYLIRDNKKHYISHPRVFANNRWPWSVVQTVDADWLNNLPNGATISK